MRRQLTNGCVIDCVGDSPKPERVTVVVHDGKIERVEPGPVPATPDAEVVDVHGA